MKKIIFLFVAFTISFATFAQEKAGKKDTAQHIILYACAMHPGVSTDKPGKCPLCNMDLTRSKKELLKSEVTKAYTCPVHADVLSDKGGKCSKCGTQLNLSLKEKMKAEVVGLYKCTMHPDVASDKPGKCSKCGMDLTATKEKSKE